MTDRDYDNVQFLLTASDIELDQWFDAMPEQERTYALSLLLEMQQDVINLAVDMMASWPEATAVLNDVKK